MSAYRRALVAVDSIFTSAGSEVRVPNSLVFTLLEKKMVNNNFEIQ